MLETTLWSKSVTCEKQQLVDKYNKVLKRSFKSTKPKVRMQKHPHA